MLPVLFTLTLSPLLAKALACAALALVVGLRAWAFRRRAGGDEAVGWWAALRDDGWTIAALACAVAAAWWHGLLDGTVRLPLHTYGLLIAIGFIIGIALAQRAARRAGLDADRVGDLAFWVLAAALVGSRVYFIAVNWRDYFGANAWIVLGGVRFPRVLAVWEGGLVFYGGFIAAALTAFWYLRRHRMPFLPYGDALIPSVALGHFFGRLGCFAAGCCWGSAAHVPWAAKFPPAALAYQALALRPDAAELIAPGGATTVALHPTQIYEALGELAIFVLLTAIVRPRKRFEGQLLAVWLGAYALLRTAVELFRGDVERGVVWGLGVGQWTSALILLGGVLVWAVGRRATAPRRGGAALAA